MQALLASPQHLALDVHDHQGQTPLTLAAISSCDVAEEQHSDAMEASKAIVNSLLDANATVDFPSVGGQTALMLAAHNGLIELVNVLLEYEASPQMCDANGHNSLMLATDSNNDEMTELLLKGDQATSLIAATSNEVPVV